MTLFLSVRVTQSNTGTGFVEKETVLFPDIIPGVMDVYHPFQSTSARVRGHSETSAPFFIMNRASGNILQPCDEDDTAFLPHGVRQYPDRFPG